MQELLKSKRIRVAVAAVAIGVAARLGLHVDAELVNKLLDLAMVVVASFGLTGLGKERVIEAAKLGATTSDIEIHTTNPPPIAPTSTPASPLQPARRTSRSTPTTPDLGGEARRLREEARGRTPAPPLPPPPRGPTGE